MKLSADTLRDLTGTICKAGGSDDAEADAVARNLVDANLFGHDSHGIGMIPTYVDAVLQGRLIANRHVEVTRDAGSILQLDGCQGYGQVIGAEAMELGIARAKANGVAVVALRNSHHLGRIGAWGEMCAAAGLVSIHYVNASAARPLVAPFGGSDGRFTTDPYCTAIPATGSNPPLIFDMATSKIAQGKVRVAYNKGVPVPEGCLIDSKGVPTNDPGVMFEAPRGALRPVGDHKGYGLALICEALAGALAGGGVFLPENQSNVGIINNMLTIILDPAAVGDADFFAREIDAMTANVKASPPAPGVEAVMVPGDPERKSAVARSRDGIPVDEQTWRDILAAAGKVGVPEAALAAFPGD